MRKGRERQWGEGKVEKKKKKKRVRQWARVHPRLKNEIFDGRASGKGKKKRRGSRGDMREKKVEKTRSQKGGNL